VGARLGHEFVLEVLLFELLSLRDPLHLRVLSLLLQLVVHRHESLVGLALRSSWAIGSEVSVEQLVDTREVLSLLPRLQFLQQTFLLREGLVQWSLGDFQFDTSLGHVVLHLSSDERRVVVGSSLFLHELVVELIAVRVRQTSRVELRR